LKSDGCGYRENRSIIEYSEINQLDIGQAAQEWTKNYNATQGRRMNDILQIGVMHPVT
jgi:hypothetical protein